MIGFAEPLYLLALALAVPAAALAALRLARRRRADLDAFGERSLLERSSVLPGERGRLAAQTLVILALALVLLALARPQLGVKPMVLTRTGRDVLYVLDLSRSMNAEDVAPSRLGAAKQAVRELLESSPGDRVGLLVFGGSAYLQVPLTLDRAAFGLFLETADTDDISDTGSDLGAALATAASAFREEGEPRYRALVLLSDGEHLQGDLEASLRTFKRSGVRVFTLGVGSPGGAPIPLREGVRLVGYHRGPGGEVVVTRLEEGTLRRIAGATDGSYARLGGGGTQRLAAELAQLEAREITSRTALRRAERYQWPLALALLALAAESLLSGRRAGSGRRSAGAGLARWGRRARKGSGPGGGALLWLAMPLAALVATLLAALVASPVAAQERSAAERLYRAGRYEEAYRAFARMAEEEDAGHVLHYDAGNALYRLGRYDAAAGRFRTAAGGPAEVRQKSAYNLGNAFFKASEAQPDARPSLRRAIAAYEKALVLDPRDLAAKWNLELALRRLAEEERRQQMGGGGGGGDRGGSSETPSPDSQPEGGRERGADGGAGGEAAPESPSERAPTGRESASGQTLTQAQARQLLEALQSEEREVLESREGEKARVSSGGMDW